MPDVKAVKRGEVLLKDAFCVFELIETEEQVKLRMQAPVAIDFLAHSSDGYVIFCIFLFTESPFVLT